MPWAMAKTSSCRWDGPFEKRVCGTIPEPVRQTSAKKIRISRLAWRHRPGNRQSLDELSPKDDFNHRIDQAFEANGSG
jgi:hypothetical protein